MEKKDKVFADGIIFKRNDNAPAFVIGKQSFKVKEAVAFLLANEKNGWVNVNINQAQSGKYYIELDTWEATGAKPTYTKALDLNGDMANEFNNTDLPF
jgi:hypothetical protein